MQSKRRLKKYSNHSAVKWGANLRKAAINLLILRHPRRTVATRVVFIMKMCMLLQ